MDLRTTLPPQGLRCLEQSFPPPNLLIPCAPPTCIREESQGGV